MSSQPHDDGIAPYPLADYDGERPPIAPWIADLDLAEPESHRVKVLGANIEFCTWGQVDRPGILLVHGLLAHSRWWGPVAPLLAKDFRVASLSLSGMGGSDWRTEYSFHQHAQEMLAVLQHAGLFHGAVKPALIAHSFGAQSAAVLAADHGEKLSRVIMVDTGIAPGKRPLSSIRGRRYKTLGHALSRFRLSPPQKCPNPWLVDEVARQGLVQDADGLWRWCFDPEYAVKLRYSCSFELLQHSKCPMAFVYGENSALTPAPVRAAQRQQAPAGTTFTQIPDAAHHVMHDQPIRLASKLRELLPVPGH